MWLTAWNQTYRTHTSLVVPQNAVIYFHLDVSSFVWHLPLFFNNFWHLPSCTTRTCPYFHRFPSFKLSRAYSRYAEVIRGMLSAASFAGNGSLLCDLIAFANRIVDRDHLCMSTTAVFLSAFIRAPTGFELDHESGSEIWLYLPLLPIRQPGNRAAATCELI